MESPNDLIANLVFSTLHIVLVGFVSNNMDFLFNNQDPKHVSIGLFEATVTNSATMVPKLWELLDKFFRTDNILAYVKDKGINLQSCVTTLTFVVFV